MAASKASAEAICLRRLLKSSGTPQPRVTTPYEDKRAFQLMSESPAHRETSRHIHLRVLLLKEQVKNGVVRLFECPNRVQDGGRVHQIPPGTQVHRAP